MKALGFRAKTIVWICLATLITCCQHNDSYEMSQPQSKDGLLSRGDTISVEKYSIKGIENSKLSNWISFKINNQTIYTPPGWKSQNVDGSLVIMSPETLHYSARIELDRYYQNLPSANYDSLAQALRRASFNNYELSEKESLRKLVAAKGIIYESSSTARKRKNIVYNTFILYLDKEYVYKYFITIENKSNPFASKILMRDIIANILVEGYHLIGDENRVSKIIIL